MKRILVFFYEMILLSLYLFGIFLFIMSMFFLGDAEGDIIVFSSIIVVLAAFIVKIKVLRNDKLIHYINYVLGPFLVLVGYAIFKDAELPTGFLSLLESVFICIYLMFFKNSYTNKVVNNNENTNIVKSDTSATDKEIIEVDVTKAYSMISDKKAVEKYYAPTKQSEQIVRNDTSVLTMNVDALEELSINDIDRISDMSNSKKKGDLFEKYCCRILELNNFHSVKRVGGAGDRGADIEARKGPKKFIIQCKCYKGPVPYAAFQATMSARKLNMAEGIIMTNSHFSKRTIEDSEDQGIILWDRERLIELIENANEELKWKARNE